MTEETEDEILTVSPIYSGDLDFNTIKDNPILKPIAEINETFINLELVINKALIEYQEIQEEINKMVDDNPVYSETMLMSKIVILKNNVKQIIHSQDLQKTNMKDKIIEMIRIVDEEYDIKPDEEIVSEKVSRPKDIEPIKPKPEIKDDYDDTFKKLKEITGEKEKPSEEKEEIKKNKYSDLVEREVPIEK